MAEEEKPWWQTVGDAVGGAVDDARKAAGEAIDAARNSNPGKAIEGAIGEGQKRIDETRKGVEGAVTDATTRAQAAGSAVLETITGEESGPVTLDKGQIFELQKVLKIPGPDGVAGKGTKAALEKFANEHGIEAPVVANKVVTVSPEFLAAVEKDAGDLTFFEPSATVQKRLNGYLESAQETAGNLAAGAKAQADKAASAIGGAMSSEGEPDGPQPNDECRKLAAEYRAASGFSAAGVALSAATSGCDTNVPPFRLGSGSSRTPTP